MAYTYDSAKLTAAMAHAQASTTKTEFATDLGALLTELDTQKANYSEAVAAQLEVQILDLASTIASAIKDVA